MRSLHQAAIFTILIGSLLVIRNFVDNEFAFFKAYYFTTLVLMAVYILINLYKERSGKK